MRNINRARLLTFCTLLRRSQAPRFSSTGNALNYIVFDQFGKEKSRIFYDESLQRLDLELDETPLFKGEFVLPQNIREMIQLSEILSNQEPLVLEWIATS
jgi:hypothetical protein